MAGLERAVLVGVDGRQMIAGAAQVEAGARSIQGSMARTDAAMLSAQAQINATTATAQRMSTALGAGGLTSTMTKLIGGTTGLTVIIASLGAAMASSGAKAEREFESRLVKINTLVGTSLRELDGLRGTIVRLSAETGRPLNELAEGLFAVQSGGIKGARSLEILEQAAKGAVIGLGSTRDIAVFATAAMLAYEKQNLSAAKATEILLKTVREGQIPDAGALAGTLGRVLGLASLSDVPLSQVGAFVATSTRLGVSIEESVTGLRSLLASLLHSTDDAKEAFVQLGLPLDELRKKIGREGLAQAFGELLENVNALGTPGKDLLAKAIPNIRALVGLLNTAGVSGAEFIRIAESMERQTGDLASGFKTTGETAAQAAERAANAWDLLKHALGEGFSGPLSKLKSAFADFVETLNSIDKVRLTLLVALLGGTGPTGQLLGAAAVNINKGPALPPTGLTGGATNWTREQILAFLGLGGGEFGGAVTGRAPYRLPIGRPEADAFPTIRFRDYQVPPVPGQYVPGLSEAERRAALDRIDEINKLIQAENRRYAALQRSNDMQRRAVEFAAKLREEWDKIAADIEKAGDKIAPLLGVPKPTIPVPPYFGEPKPEELGPGTFEEAAKLARSYGRGNEELGFQVDQQDLIRGNWGQINEQVEKFVARLHLSKGEAEDIRRIIWETLQIEKDRVELAANTLFNLGVATLQGGLGGLRQALPGSLATVGSTLAQSMFASPFAGQIGGLVGQGAGQLIANFLTPSQTRYLAPAQAFGAPGGGGVGYTAVGGQIGALSRQIHDIVTALIEQIDGYLVSLGSIGVRIRQDGEKFKAEFQGHVLGVFDSVEEALDRAIVEGLRHAEFIGVSETVQAVLSSSNVSTVADLQELLKTASEIDALNLNQAASSLRDLFNQFDRYFAFMDRFNLSIQDLTDILVGSIQELRDSITDLFSDVGVSQLTQQVHDLTRQKDDAVEAATAFNQQLDSQRSDLQARIDDAQQRYDDLIRRKEIAERREGQINPRTGLPWETHPPSQGSIDEAAADLTDLNTQLEALAGLDIDIESEILEPFHEAMLALGNEIRKDLMTYVETPFETTFREFQTTFRDIAENMDDLGISAIELLGYYNAGIEGFQRDAITGAKSLLADLYDLLGDDKEAAQLRFDLQLAEFRIRQEELRIEFEKLGLNKELLKRLDVAVDRFEAKGPDFSKDTAASSAARSDRQRQLQQLAEDRERFLLQLVKLETERLTGFAGALQQWEEQFQDLARTASELGLGLDVLQRALEVTGAALVDSFLQPLRDLREDLTSPSSGFSTLTASQQFNQDADRIRQLTQAALGGDLSSLETFAPFAREAVTRAQDYFGTGAAAFQQRQLVLDAIDQLTAAGIKLPTLDEIVSGVDLPDARRIEVVNELRQTRDETRELFEERVIPLLRDIKGETKGTRSAVIDLGNKLTSPTTTSTSGSKPSASDALRTY